MSIPDTKEGWEVWVKEGRARKLPSDTNDEFLQVIYRDYDELKQALVYIADYCKRNEDTNSQIIAILRRVGMYNA